MSLARALAVARAVLGDVPGGHADSFTTSLWLRCRPSEVRADRLRKPQLTEFEWSLDMDCSAISDTGVVGDPTHASAAAGEAIWRSLVEEGVAITRHNISGEIEAVRQRWHFLPGDG